VPVVRPSDGLKSGLHTGPNRSATYRTLVATEAFTGLRWGETVGLCRDAFDLDGRITRVIRTVVEVAAVIRRSSNDAPDLRWRSGGVVISTKQSGYQPGGAQAQRYWDSRQWTSSVQPPQH
jgi:integrase